MVTQLILRQARALIERPERWCKGRYACTEDGLPTSYHSTIATQWCALGALLAQDASWDMRGAARLMLEACLPGERPDHYLSSDINPVAKFNDAETTTHADILSLYDCAIDRAGRDSE